MRRSSFWPDTAGFLDECSWCARRTLILHSVGRYDVHRSQALLGSVCPGSSASRGFPFSDEDFA